MEYTAPTQEQIQEWKTKHKDVFCIEVMDKEGIEYPAYLRRPKMNDLEIASNSERKKAGTFNKSIYNNCKLSVHPAIEADDQYLLPGVLSQLDEIVEFANAKVKKL
jgi:hypothetical protein